jgi:hypothetical protein
VHEGGPVGRLRVFLPVGAAKIRDFLAVTKGPLFCIAPAFRYRRSWRRVAPPTVTTSAALASIKPNEDKTFRGDMIARDTVLEVVKRRRGQYPLSE